MTTTKDETCFYCDAPLDDKGDCSKRCAGDIESGQPLSIFEMYGKDDITEDDFDLGLDPNRKIYGRRW